MLVYVRESEIADVLRPMTEADIPSHLVDRFTEEERESEKRKLEKRDQHKIAHLTVATAKDLLANHGAELCEWEKV
jgi:ubiquitin carboxyl-terminal hydrolase 7